MQTCWKYYSACSTEETCIQDSLVTLKWGCARTTKYVAGTQPPIIHWTPFETGNTLSSVGSGEETLKNFFEDMYPRYQ